MKPLKTRHKARLLQHIAQDIEGAATLARAAAQAASHHAETGRLDQALQHILEAEPAIFDAQKLISLATYLSQIGKLEAV